MFNPAKSKILTPLTDPLFKEYGITVLVKREDLVHEIAGGNKWRKLKYNLEKAKHENKNTIVTFGGAWSNHIAATAFAGNEFGFKTIGIIRGEKTNPLNITLKRAEQNGMKLIFVDRTTYRNKELSLKAALGNYDKNNLHIIPEGGSNTEGFKGCCEIVQEIDAEFDFICCPVGTGVTLAGIASSLKEKQKAIGFAVMKKIYSFEKIAESFFNHHETITKTDWNNIECFYNYHFGGYAKSNNELNNFVSRFAETNKIEIEPVYTGKMFYGIYDLIKKGFFNRGDVIIAVHTGGLQYLKP
ncbi:MAG: 1-aminocyclopropane-1-carboxylate deaminase/D-cysteine desulfhydrase [Bacteroidia bacterium]